jgi:hypothetical protein
LQRASPDAQARHALELQLVALSETVQSAELEQVSQSMKPVKSLLHICSVLLPEPPQRVWPEEQAGGSHTDLPAWCAASHRALLLQVSMTAACELMRLAGH